VNSNVSKRKSSDEDEQSPRRTHDIHDEKANDDDDGVVWNNDKQRYDFLEVEGIT